MDTKSPVFLQTYLQPASDGFTPYEFDGDFAIDLSLVHASTEAQVEEMIRFFADIYETLEASGREGCFFDFILVLEKLGAENSVIADSKLSSDERTVLKLLKQSRLIASFQMSGQTLYTRTPHGECFLSQVYAYVKQKFGIERFHEYEGYMKRQDLVLTLKFIRYLLVCVREEIDMRAFERIREQTMRSAYDAMYGAEHFISQECAEA